METKPEKSTKHKKLILDDLITRLLNPSTVINDDDVPYWLTTLVLTIYTLYIPFNIYLQHPEYLCSSSVYPNGVHIHKFLQEAIHFKETLRQGSFNFWNDHTALGYPMFMGMPPLSTVLFGSAFLLLERFVGVLQIARCMIVILMMLIPVSFYKSSRLLMLSRTQSLFIALMTFAVDSELETGIEIQATLQHGLIEQLIAMIILPMAVSYTYLHFMRIGPNHTELSPVYLLTLGFLTHCLTGIYISTVATITCIFYIIKKQLNSKYIESSAYMLIKLNACVLFYTSWWLIPSLISYPYMAGRFRYMKINTLRSSLLESLINGDLLDYMHSFIWIIAAVILSLFCLVYSIYGYSNKQLIHWHRTAIFKLWLIVIFLISICLFTFNQYIVNFISLIFPIQVDADNSSFLFGLHFCVIIIASYPIEYLCNGIEYLKFKKKFQKMLKIMFVITVAVTLANTMSEKFQEKTTYIKIQDSFQEKLKVLDDEYPDSRMLVHQKLGTGGAWDTTHLPRLSGKPGVFSYTEGHPSGLSLFYLDAITENNISPTDFVNYLRLYNIRFMAISENYLKMHELNSDSLNKLFSINDIQIFQVDDDEETFGYFDFVRLPGFIDGDLYHINMPVLNSLDLYKDDMLLFINPRWSSAIRTKPLLNIQVFEFAKGILPFSILTTWKFNYIEMDSDSALQNMQKKFSSSRTSTSNIIEEKRFFNEYHVIVDVKDKGSEMEEMEHLVLKVTYHPFWRCVYYPVNDSYKLSDAKKSQDKIKYTSVSVNHVTPNFIAVTLPPGKHHVVFCYRFPGILKILALVCFIMFCQHSLRIRIMETSLRFLSTLINKCGEIIIATFRALYRIIIFVYYLFDNDSASDKINVVSSFFETSVSPFRKVINTTKYYLNIIGLLNTLTTNERTENDTDSDDVMTTNHVTKENVLKDVSVSPWPSPPSSFDKIATEKELTNNADVKESLDSQNHNNTCDSLASTSLLDQSSDMDISFENERFVRSPPTPPKHCKKSLRKKHSRFKNDSTDFKFRNSPSPILGNIMNSLRKNSLSPEKIDRSRTNFKEELLKCRQELNESPPKSSEVFNVSPYKYEAVQNNSHVARDSIIPKSSYDNSFISSDSLPEFILSSFESNSISTVQTDKTEDNSENEDFRPNRSSSPNSEVTTE